jgi:hypothetical protein
MGAHGTTQDSDLKERPQLSKCRVQAGEVSCSSTAARVIDVSTGSNVCCWSEV